MSVLFKEKEHVEVLIEQFNLEKEVDNLDDESLVEEIMNFADRVDLPLKVESILSNYMGTGKLYEDERKDLIAIYKLCHSSVVLDDDK